MTQGWEPERTLTLDDVAEVLASRVPELSDQPGNLLGEGWDNSVFQVGRWALRFPRRRMALAGIRREIAVLPTLASLLPLPIPSPVIVGEDLNPSDPWPFTGAPLLPGDELALRQPSDDERVAVAAQVGGFLRELHSPATRVAAEAQGCELPVDPLDRGWPASHVENTTQALRVLADAGVWTPDLKVETLLEHAGSLGAPSDDVVLVHGDLHIRHVLVGEGAAVTGVIDWGDLCLASPALDLAVAFAAFEGDSRRAFFDAYGPAGGDVQLRARALAVRLSALLARYALNEERWPLLSASLAGLDRSVTG